MATLYARTESMVGSLLGLENEFDIWAEDGIVDVIRRFVEIDALNGRGDLHRFSQEVAIGSGTAGLTLGVGLHFMGDSVRRGTYESSEIPATMRHRAAKSTSRYRATNQNPKHYFQEGKIFILPSPTAENQALANYLLPATVSGTGFSDINNFPADLYYLVVLYIARQVLKYKMGTLAQAADATLPTVPTIGSFSEVSATLPTYTSIPKVVLPDAPDAADVDFSGIGDDPVFLIPDSPSLPSFSLPADPTITMTESLPSYTKATASLTSSNAMDTALTTITSQITGHDPELSTETIKQVQAAVAAYRSDMENEQLEESTKATAYDLELKKELADVEVFTAKVSAYIRDYEANVSGAIREHETLVLANAEAYKAELQNWAKEIDKALAEYQAETGYDVSKYRAEVEAVIAEQVQDISNESTEFSAKVEKYIAELQKVTEANQRVISQYMGEIQLYASEAQTVLADMRAKMDKKQQQYSWYMDQYARLTIEYEKGFMPYVQAQPEGN